MCTYGRWLNELEVFGQPERCGQLLCRPRLVPGVPGLDSSTDSTNHLIGRRRDREKQFSCCVNGLLDPTGDQADGDDGEHPARQDLACRVEAVYQGLAPRQLRLALSVVETPLFPCHPHKDSRYQFGACHMGEVASKVAGAPGHFRGEGDVVLAQRAPGEVRPPSQDRGPVPRLLAHRYRRLQLFPSFCQVGALCQIDPKETGALHLVPEPGLERNGPGGAGAPQYGLVRQTRVSKQVVHVH